MREELAFAYKNYNETQLKLDLWKQQHTDPNLYPPPNHPISQEKRNNYLRIDENRNKFIDCFKLSLSQIKVWIDGSNMIFVEWGLSNAQIVIEFSFYGSIVFLSSYGAVTDEIFEAVDNCLSKCHLIRLNKEEIDELNNSGLFNSFF